MRAQSSPKERCWKPRNNLMFSGKLTDKDRREWDAYAERVAPMRRRSQPKPAASPAPAPTPQPAPRRAPSTPAPDLAVGDQPGGLDRGSWQRFRSGRTAPSRTLDLHGRTAQRAYHALHAFLHAAQADGVRCVEIVTGRGTGESGGVLRRELPMWLNSPALRPLVLAARHPHPANPGAVRLLLRRAR
jgi:DNA-nicking Smr family endonuclease